MKRDPTHETHYHDYSESTEHSHPKSITEHLQIKKRDHLPQQIKESTTVLGPSIARFLVSPGNLTETIHDWPESPSSAPTPASKNQETAQTHSHDLQTQKSTQTPEKYGCEDREQRKLETQATKHSVPVREVQRKNRRHDSTSAIRKKHSTTLLLPDLPMTALQPFQG